MLGHFCLERPDGIRISNVWDGDEHAKADVENPVLREALAKAQMPAVTPQFFPVHNHFIVSEMAAGVSENWGLAWWPGGARERKVPGIC